MDTIAGKCGCRAPGIDNIGGMQQLRLDEIRLDRLITDGAKFSSPFEREVRTGGGICFIGLIRSGLAI